MGLLKFSFHPLVGVHTPNVRIALESIYMNVRGEISVSFHNCQLCAEMNESFVTQRELHPGVTFRLPERQDQAEP